MEKPSIFFFTYINHASPERGLDGNSRSMHLPVLAAAVAAKQATIFSKFRDIVIPKIRDDE